MIQAGILRNYCHWRLEVTNAVIYKRENYILRNTHKYFVSISVFQCKEFNILLQIWL